MLLYWAPPEALDVRWLQRFAEGGYHMHLLGRDPARLGEARDAITASTGGRADVVECHVSDPDFHCQRTCEPPTRSTS